MGRKKTQKIAFYRRILALVRPSVRHWATYRYG
jgi:hypothetical protein